MSINFLGKEFSERKIYRMNNGESPLVSILLTTYNRESLVKKTIESILNQTYPHFELIIIDDASSDKTLARIESFKYDPRVFIFKNEMTRGQTASLNMGISTARGIYIANCDAGDWWDIRKLQAQVDFMEAHPDYIICGTQTYNVDESGGLLGISSFAENDFAIRKNFFLERGIYSHPTILFRSKKIYYRNAFYYSQDLDLYMRLSFFGKLYCIQTPLAYITQHGCGVTIGKKYYQRQYQRLAYDLFKQRLINERDNLDLNKQIKLRDNVVSKKVCSMSMYFFRIYVHNKLKQKHLLSWFFPILISSLLYPPILFDYLRKCVSIFRFPYYLKKYNSFFNNSTPRILLISDFIYPVHVGGASREVFDFLSWLNDKLYFCSLIYRGGSSKYSLSTATSTEPLILSHSCAIKFDFKLAIFLRFFQAITFINDATVIYIHHPILGVLFYFIFAQKNKYIVYHFHGPFADEYYCKTLKKGIGYWIRHTLQKFIILRAHRIIVHSDYMKKKVIEIDNTSMNRICILPPTVDIHEFKIISNRLLIRNKYHIPVDSSVIFINRRITKRTGVIDFTNQFHELVRLFPKKLYLLITGGGEGQNELTHLTDCCENIRYIPLAAPEDLPFYYSASDICILPSRDLEGFGLVILEAFACGIPVLVSHRSGGAKEFIITLDNKLIYELDNVNSLASSLDYALEKYKAPNSELRDIAEKFDRDLIFPSYIDILSTLNT